MKAEWIERYSRQILLPEIGYSGQKRLEKARVLVIGVGTLGLVDDGVVERSNLHRQVVYTEADLGKPKVEALANRLLALNPDVTVHPLATRLTAKNARSLVSEFDLVVDGTDNFATRYIINDACYFEQKPWVYASVYRTYGQLTVFHPPHSPCYRCLLPSVPATAVPDCARAGVVGPLPGILGLLQATEVIKATARFGDIALGFLLNFDLATLTFRRLVVKRNPACKLCGDSPTITDVSEEAVQACLSDIHRTPSPSTETAPSSLESPRDTGLPDDRLEVEPKTVAALLKNPNIPVVLLDVREEDEVRLCRLEGSVWIPLEQLPARAQELDPRKTLIAYCHTGNRSLVAAQWLRDNGFPLAYSLAGGIDRWAQEIDPSLPRY